MKIIEKDILTVEKGIIISQVNCKGVQGSGLAKSIRDKWPIVFHNYSNLCKNYKPDYLLGKIDPVLVDTRNGELWVVNLFGQDNYGRDNVRYTEYFAWDLALKELHNLVNIRKVLPKDVCFPYGCGAGLGKGNWDIILGLIGEYFPNAIICKLPKKV